MARLILCSLIWLLASHCAHASLSIDRAIVVFEPGKSPRQDVYASNNGEDNLFLELEVLEVLSPGTAHEERREVRDPEAIGFVAAPRRLMVPPGGRRPIRLMNLLGHGDTERVYRITVRPVLPPSESRGMGVKIIIAYQMLVFIAPRQAAVELTARREGNHLTLTNNGNVNVLLRSGTYCPTVGAKDCEELTGRRLYPGNEWLVELPGMGPVEFNVEADGKRLVKRF